jgi:hypothetical protein
MSKFKDLIEAAASVQNLNEITFKDTMLKELLQLKQRHVKVALSFDNRKGKKLDDEYDKLINFIKTLEFPS